MNEVCLTILFFLTDSGVMKLNLNFELLDGVFLTFFTSFVLVFMLYILLGVEDLSLVKLSRILISLVFPIRLNDGFGVPGDKDFFLTRINFLSPIFLKGVFLNGVERKLFLMAEGRFSFSSAFLTGVVNADIVEEVLAVELVIIELATDDLGTDAINGVDVDGVGFD